MTKFLIFVLLLFPAVQYVPASADESRKLESVIAEFEKGYRELGIPDFGYDYRENFSVIPAVTALVRQDNFFHGIQQKLNAIQPQSLSINNLLNLDHLIYQCRLNLERIRLEKEFRQEGENIPAGLHSISNGKEWYRYYIRFFTGTGITPEELYDFGLKEISRIKGQIAVIQKQAGFGNDSAGFYRHLLSDEFILTDKQEVIRKYEEIRETVFSNLHHLFIDTVPDVAIMTWAGARANTPPGYYNPESENAYGKGVFHFNFYGERHNRRMMEWLFLHEAVPGHHYQSSIRNTLSQPAFSAFFYYPGNFEGWAAYVEYLGKDLGLYADPYSFLGKWEWDLVRSTRIVIDVGIHYYGWSKNEAMEFWKKNIPHQDDIAEREVNRCTNWPAQALSYKVGADRILKMINELKKNNRNFSLPEFHRTYLTMGSLPLEVIEKNINQVLLWKEN